MNRTAKSTQPPLLCLLLGYLIPPHGADILYVLSRKGKSGVGANKNHRNQRRKEVTGLDFQIGTIIEIYSLERLRWETLDYYCVS